MHTDFASIHVGSKMMQFRSKVFGTWPPLMDHRHFNGPGVIFEQSAVNPYLMVKDIESFFFISLRSSIIGMDSLRAYDNPVYSAFVVLSAPDYRIP